MAEELVGLEVSVDEVEEGPASLEGHVAYVDGREFLLLEVVREHAAEDGRPRREDGAVRADAAAPGVDRDVGVDAVGQHPAESGEGGGRRVLRDLVAAPN